MSTEPAGDPAIRVLVVDDEPIAADAHAAYVRRMEGFALAAVAHDGQGTLHALKDAAAAGAPIQLILLDMNLPDLHGLDVSRRIRSAGYGVDIIAITAVRELAIVRGAVSAGIVQYLIKPFTFAAFAEKLANYRQFRRQLESQGQPASQSDVDSAFASLRTPGETPLPKGLSQDSLDSVAALLRSGGRPVSATEAMAELGMSRVTARRYLEFLAESGKARRASRYGTGGRPESEYHWIG
ncbi:response regulator [Arthrobacter sp. 35W]|uniref:response regulator n=1 Tax=Arthrobacter sp. 35W TaxID=1132441 RepID=UPI0003FB2ADF|nr:response regulator [Arthrobacter sp. 35W]